MASVSYYAAESLLGTVSQSVFGYGGARLIAVRSPGAFDRVKVVGTSADGSRSR